MPPEELMQYVPQALAVIALLAVLVALQFTPAKRRRRRNRALERVPIGELTPGTVVKVRGTVVLDEVLESPILQERCACWRVEASFQQYSQAQRGMVWYRSVRGEAQRDFLLQDATGTVRVAAEGAKLDVMSATREHRSDDLPEHIARFLKSQGSTLLDPGRKTHPMRFEEWAVTEGAELEVVGQVRAGLHGPMLVGAPGVPVAVQDEKPAWL